MPSDPDAFGDFYELYAERVLRFFARRVVQPDVAFDLTSETFATALERCRQFRGSTIEEEQGWLFAIARSQLSHFWRRGAVERAALTRLGIPAVTLDAEELERIEALADLDDVRGQVAAALGTLSGDQREAVQMRVVGEMEYADIAGRSASPRTSCAPACRAGCACSRPIWRPSNCGMRDERSAPARRRAAARAARAR